MCSSNFPKFIIKMLYPEAYCPVHSLEEVTIQTVSNKNCETGRKNERKDRLRRQKALF